MRLSLSLIPESLFPNAERAKRWRRASGLDHNTFFIDKDGDLNLIVDDATEGGFGVVTFSNEVTLNFDEPGHGAWLRDKQDENVEVAYVLPQDAKITFTQGELE